MTRKASGRRVKPVAVNNMQMALASATKFTATELRQLLLPPQDALESMRKGAATEIQWMHLASVSAIALSVEHLGVVRHLKAQLDEADNVLAVIRQRAMKTGAWVPPILYGHEITAIQDLVRLHKFQAESLSAGEYRAAWQHAAAEVTRVGGRHISVTEQAAAC